MNEYSNLVELCRDFVRKEISLNTFKEELKNIEVFEPIEAEDETEDTVYFNGNKNSWFEVRAYLKLSNEQLRNLIEIWKEA